MRRRVRTRTVALLTAAVGMSAPAVAGVQEVKVRPLPNDRLGTVLQWRGASKSAVVALRSGRLVSVHSLRRVTPGTRVRIDGIKWGTPTSGIKWGTAPSGIKWGIKWARNGTFSSRLTSLRQVGGSRVRGVVVRRYRNGVAIGTRGGIVVVRMAVWLPKSGKSVNGAQFPVVGDLVTTNVRFGARGRLIGDGVRIIPTSGRPVIPVAGELASVSSSARTIRIASVPDPAFSVTTTLGVPSTIDMAKLSAGSEVAGTASVATDGSLRVESIGPNDSFEAANDPSAQLVAPPPLDTAVQDLIRTAIQRWDSGRAQGGVPDQAVYDTGARLLAQALVAAQDGNVPLVTAALEEYRVLINGAVPAKVTPQVAADELARIAVIVSLVA